jgi:hypothetical protein
MLPAAGIANGTGEIAGVADFNQGETTVLLVIGAEPTVVGTTEFDRGVVDHRLLGCLDEYFAGTPVVVNVIGYEDTLVTVLRATLQHPYVAILKNDFGIDPAVACGANGDGHVVEKVGPELLRHDGSFL